tara:strand:- start:3527 stop:5095 length:1569 start_codon:yes stop_codon:yes gene_type:complete
VSTQHGYLTEVQANLPRLLALVDRDITSTTYGLGDRYHWAWGLIDFSNATFQGMVNGLARLWCSGLWPYRTPKSHFLKFIDSLYIGAEKITRPDGSLAEAFPNEGSFCVTALVAFDLLVAYDLLKEQIDYRTQQRWIETIRPMVGYLIQAEETHAIISNHLATAVAALARWHMVSGEKNAETRAQELLARILNLQSDEGWFVEYGGADPGYQSLCTYYLADAHYLRPDWRLIEPLRHSILFLWHFAHPDGSFGGLYGSRYTRFYYPAGIAALSNEIPEAATLAAFMERSIVSHKVVTLSSIDEPNLVPTFNAYCWAATLKNRKTDEQGRRPLLELPALQTKPFCNHYKEAGLLVDRGKNHYTVIAINKGGIVYHFVDGKPPLMNSGVVVRDANGRLGSNHAPGERVVDKEQRSVVISSPITQMSKRSPGPWQFLILRLFCVTVFRLPKVREWVKQQLVRLLITGGKLWPIKNRRTIHLGPDIRIYDETKLRQGFEVVKDVHHFIPIHMASQGYWQRQDEEEI